MIFVDCDTYKHQTGIYAIENMKDGAVYVGQTKENFMRRYWHHRWLLRNGKHSNHHLQESWNLYRELSFLFRVLEVCTDDFDSREQYYIAKARETGLCFNIQDGGHENNLVRFCPDEARKRVGELNRQRMTGTKLSDETKAKMSSVRTGRIVRRKTDVITPEVAFEIKSMFIAGYSSRDIMAALNIPYKPVNMILSADTWSSIKVDGWDEFQATRTRGKGHRVQR